MERNGGVGRMQRKQETAHHLSHANTLFSCCQQHIFNSLRSDKANTIETQPEHEKGTQKCAWNVVDEVVPPPQRRASLSLFR